MQSSTGDSPLVFVGMFCVLDAPRRLAKRRIRVAVNVSVFALDEGTDLNEGVRLGRLMAVATMRAQGPRIAFSGAERGLCRRLIALRVGRFC